MVVSNIPLNMLNIRCFQFSKLIFHFNFCSPGIQIPHQNKYEKSTFSSFSGWWQSNQQKCVQVGCSMHWFKERKDALGNLVVIITSIGNNGFLNDWNVDLQVYPLCLCLFYSTFPTKLHVCLFNLNIAIFFKEILSKALFEKYQWLNEFISI